MIKKIFIIVTLFFIFPVTFANNYIEKTIDWYKFRVIKFDTKSKDYIFKVWVNNDYNASSLRTLMEENNWISAINWVFFCPADYRECWWKDFTKNERYVSWTKISNESWTQDRVVFAWDKDNFPFLFQTDKINRLDEDKIYYWLANFPLLLQDWESKFQEYVDLWLIDWKMKAKMQRNFVCSDKSDRYIYSWYVSDIELEKLPEELIKLWCKNAINLDAWKSSAMIYNSRYIIWPGRDILDWIIVERKGLDTKQLLKTWNKIKEIIHNKIKDKTYDEKIEFLNSISKWLSKIRSDIYKKNSHDIFENDKKVWYEINVKDLKKLQTVYLVNYLNKLFYDLQNEYTTEENIRLQQEKTNQNKQELLF